MFVAAVSQLGVALARDPSAAVYGRFAALFAIVLWAWVLYALYANRFDTDDLIFRMAKCGAMLAIAAAAVNLHQVMQGRGGTVGFAAAYTALRVLLIGLYIRARHYVVGNGRSLSTTYIIGYSSTTLVWLISIFVPEPLRGHRRGARAAVIRRRRAGSRHRACQQLHATLDRRLGHRGMAENEPRRAVTGVAVQ